MRILLVIVFGLILSACGQDYEEVYGIKIGAPISEVPDLNEYVLSSNTTGSVKSYNKRFESGELETITLRVIDNKVVGVIFSFDEDIEQGEIDRHLEDLNREYGKPLVDSVYMKFSRFIKFQGDGLEIANVYAGYYLESKPLFMISYFTEEMTNKGDGIFMFYVE